MVAAKRGHLDVVKLLLEKEAVVDKADRIGRTALIHAVKNGHLAIVSWLARMGANVNAADTSKNHAVHYAGMHLSRVRDC